MKKKLVILFFLLGLFNIFIGCLNSNNSGEDVEKTNTAKIGFISIYDEKDLIEMSIEDVAKYHGDICPCVVIVFRATQLAISELWGKEIPNREDFKIINSLPSKGAKDTFEFITRVKSRNDLSSDLPEGTSNLKTSEQNYSFVFIRKSTGEQIKVWVKKEIFQKIDKEFFSLRTKIKLKETTLEERKRFSLAKKELKDIVINLPADELFDFQEITKEDKD